MPSDYVSPNRTVLPERLHADTTQHIVVETNSYDMRKLIAPGVRCHAFIVRDITGSFSLTLLPPQG